MPELAKLLTPERVLLDLKGQSRRGVLRAAADALAPELGVNAEALLEALMDREKLGSTGVGKGMAIPHAKLDGMAEAKGAFVRLSRPVDYEAPDGEPVDLLFLLLVPEGQNTDHLKALAKCSRAFRQPGLIQELREATSPKAVIGVFARFDRPTAGA